MITLLVLTIFLLDSVLKLKRGIYQMITAGSKMAKSNVMGLVMTSYTKYPATLTG